MRLLIIILFMVSATSCEKAICKDSPKNSPVNAMIQWTGAPEADGLGWMLRLDDGKTEKPSNLADEFKIDSLKVTVAFEKTQERFLCHCATGFVEMVRITSIKKR